MSKSTAPIPSQEPAPTPGNRRGYHPGRLRKLGMPPLSVGAAPIDFDGGPIGDVRLRFAPKGRKWAALRKAAVDLAEATYVLNDLDNRVILAPEGEDVGEASAGIKAAFKRREKADERFGKLASGLQVAGVIVKDRLILNRANELSWSERVEPICDVLDKGSVFYLHEVVFFPPDVDRSDSPRLQSGSSVGRNTMRQ